ncbi:MAG TPA: hypothetical protein VGD14_06310 [bacterium]
MERFLNPELRSRTDLLLWALQYDSSFTTMIVSDSAVTKEDIRLINIIREFIPNFINYDNLDIAEKLFVAFYKDVQNRQKLISVLQNAYTEISSIFQHELNLEAPEGYIFVLVYKDRQQIGDEEIGGFVIRASRFIVIPQAYYFQRGFVLFDFDQFYAIFKHELVHAFINSLAGYDLAIEFPEWFHEMAAISLGGNRKFEAKGETIHKLSALYQEYYDAAKHLQQKFGRTKYHIFLRESIRNGDPLQRLTEQFGYESYDELRWDSMSIAEKTSETIDRFFIKMRNWLGYKDFSTSIFVILMLALPIFFAYWLVRENVDRMKDLSDVFRNAGRLQKRGDLVDSLQHYRVFLTNVHHALGWEQFFIGARNKIQHAGERVKYLQSTILDSITREIQENRIADILTAEKKCFNLEHIKNSLLKDEFHTLAEEYLSANATAIILEAWVQRDEQLKNLCRKKQYFEAIQDFINYAARHYKSDFFPHALLLKSLKSVIKLITGAYQQKSTFIRVCRQIRQIKKISSLLKRKKSLMMYHSHLSELFLASKPYCQIKRILKKVKSYRIESNLLGLKELLDVLESKPDDKALEGIVVSVIEENIIDDLIFFYDNYDVRQLIPGDALFFQSIFDNLGKLLRIIEQEEETRHKKIKQKIIKFFKSKN